MHYFSQNLKHLRKRSARTQEQLGQELRVGRTTIANYESGFSGPTDPEVLVRLSRIFGVSIDELLTRDLSEAFGPANGGAQTMFGQMSIPASGIPVRVPFVSRTEARRYLQSGEDVAYRGSLPHFGLPGLAPNDYRVFEVEEALAPRFQPADLVLCRRAPSPAQLHPGALCVLVCPAHGILLCRVRSYDGAGLRLDAAKGRQQLLAPEAIRETWLVEWLISTHPDAPQQDVYQKLESLEDQFTNLREQLQQLSPTTKPTL
ncbi:MAG: XRE family transcriptional regulator [Chitinophagaceae bacterium]|nr:MAG: XRE family transcriptional regulator [Chitinophagaceae bacterium]